MVLAATIHAVVVVVGRGLKKQGSASHSFREELRMPLRNLPEKLSCPSEVGLGTTDVNSCL